MIPVSLKLSNFTSYGENPPELDFTKFKLAAISGLNGAGKSSILDAITWCIWGISRAGDSSDELIHSGADKMYVEFCFELDGDQFTIKRSRSKKGGGSTSLELWSGNGGHNLTEGTIKTTQEKIITLLHLTFETFTNSAFLRQGHADEFTTKGPTERKRILSDILGLSNYDKLEEKAKEKVKDIQTKLQLLEYQFLEIETELSQKDIREKELTQAKKQVGEVEKNIKDLEEEVKSLQKEKETLNLTIEQHKKLQENLQKQKVDLEQIITQGKDKSLRIKDLEQSVSNLPLLEKEVDSLKSLQKQAADLISKNQQRLEIEKKLTEINGHLEIKKQRRNVIQREIDQLQKQVFDLSKQTAKCPTCGQLVGLDQKHKVLAEIKEKIKNGEKELLAIGSKVEEKEINLLTKKLESISFEKEKFEKIQERLKDLETLQLKKEVALQSRASLETEKKTLNELRSLYKNKDEQVKTLQQEFDKLPKVSQDLEQISGKLNQQELELQSLRNEEKDIRGSLGRATELISQTEQLEKLYEQRKREKSNLQKEREIYEQLQLAFGKKGIQAMIIESAIPEIEDEANKLLEKLTDGRMKVSLITQKETKTKLAGGEKGLVETLDIIISDEMGERPYEMYSGGEAFRVNFAIRLAISKLLTHRAGARLQFLVIDEGFGSQDAPGRAKLVGVIDAIKNDFEKILIITHIEELKEEFPVRIEVTKDNIGSTFEVVGV